MFVNFNDVFNNKPQTELKVPEAMLKYLSEDLPEGMSYASDEHGTCHITFENENVTISGITLNPTEEQRKILGNDFTKNDVFSYSYNSQEWIPLKLDKEGYVILNGIEIPIEKMLLRPYNPIKIISDKFYMSPPEFPKPFSLTIGCKEYSVELKIRRIPNKSVNIAAFESDGKNPLVIKYFANEMTNSISFKVSFEFSNAKTVREIIESISIYNSCLDGEIFLANKPLLGSVEYPKPQKYAQENIEFWEKLLSLEERLNVHFKPPLNDIDIDTISEVETLYQNLIQNTPIRVDKKIESLNGEPDKTLEEKCTDFVDKHMYFEFETTECIKLFGVNIELPCINGIFNAKFADYVIKGKKASIILDKEDENKPMYVSSQIFSTGKKLKEFKNIDSNDRIKIFQSAKPIQYYLQKKEN